MIYSQCSVWAQESDTKVNTAPVMKERIQNHASMIKSDKNNHSETSLAMDNMNHTGDMSTTGSMQGGSAPPDARDPNAYADGYDFGAIPRPRLADEESFAFFLADRLEWVPSNGSSSGAYDTQGWFGRTYNRAVLKAEGDIENGELTEARNELLWGHAVATYWDTQLGVRYDSDKGPERGWLAFGIQGLAPYWFDIETTGYVGLEGRTAFRFETTYDLLISQRLILQPRIETNIYSKHDPARGLGSGISDLSMGLRLRYEIRREIAPYIGVEWARKFGETKDFLRAADGNPSEVQFVAGLRLRFF